MGRGRGIAWALALGCVACSDRPLGPGAAPITPRDAAVAADLARPPDAPAPPDLGIGDLAAHDLSARAPADLRPFDLLPSPPDYSVDGATIFGDPDPTPDTWQLGAGFLVGQPITLPRVTVLRFGVITGDGCHQGRWALYQQGPLSLALSVGPQTLAVGRNEFPAPPNVLEAGTYWLAGNYDVDCRVAVQWVAGGVEVTDLVVAAAFDQPLPDPYGAPMTVLGAATFGYYLVVEPR